MAADPVEPTALCCVCHRHFAKYTCPRCRARYCSAPCYGGHSQRCTREFADESAGDALRNVRSTAEERKSMVDILKRLSLGDDAGHEEEDSDGGEGDGGWEGEGLLGPATLRALAAKLERGEEVSLDDLTEEERERFCRAANRGAVPHHVAWAPWWATADARGGTLTASGQALVAEEGPETDDPGPSALPPAWPEPLPEPAALTKSSPSPRLAWSLVAIVHAYVAVAQLYACDWAGVASEAGLDLLAFAPSLIEPHPPEGLEPCMMAAQEALGRFLAEAGMSTAAGSEQVRGAAADCASLLTAGRGAVLRCLADVKRLLDAAGVARTLGKDDRRAAATAARKVYFVACWACHALPGEAIEALAKQVAEGARQLPSASDRTEPLAVGAAVPRNPSLAGHRLVEEL